MPMIDLVETVEADNPVERKASLHIEFDKLRDENAGDAVALDDAADALAVLHDIIGVEDKFGARLRGADDVRALLA